MDPVLKIGPLTPENRRRSKSKVARFNSASKRHTLVCGDGPLVLFQNHKTSLNQSVQRTGFVAQFSYKLLGLV